MRYNYNFFQRTTSLPSQRTSTEVNVYMRRHYVGNVIYLTFSHGDVSHVFNRKTLRDRIYNAT